MNDPKVNLNLFKILQFDMNDPYINLNGLKYFRGHLRSLRGHYKVTSGSIQNAPIELKFDE